MSDKRKKVGIDIGKSSFKFVSEKGAGEIPSFLARGRLKQVMHDTLSRPSMISYGGADWILGDDATLGTNFSWKTDEEKGDERNLLFILTILERLGITDAEIVIGLPVAAAESKKKVEEVKSAFSGVKEAMVNGKPRIFTIKTSVLAEPLGTYFSLVIDEQCRPITISPFFHDQMAVIDIGYRTVDIVTLQGGKLADVRASTMSGTVNLFEKVWKAVEADYGILQWRDKVRIYDDIVHRFGSTVLKANGEIVSPKFWDRISELKEELAKDISDEIRSILSNMRPDRMLVTGGGALLLKDELVNNIRPLTFHPNPRFANAIGFYRAAQIMTEDTA